MPFMHRKGKALRIWCEFHDCIPSFISKSSHVMSPFMAAWFIAAGMHHIANHKSQLLPFNFISLFLRRNRFKLHPNITLWSICGSDWYRRREVWIRHFDVIAVSSHLATTVFPVSERDVSPFVSILCASLVNFVYNMQPLQRRTKVDERYGWWHTSRINTQMLLRDYCSCLTVRHTLI